MSRRYKSKLPNKNLICFFQCINQMIIFAIAMSNQYFNWFYAIY